MGIEDLKSEIEEVVKTEINNYITENEVMNLDSIDNNGTITESVDSSVPVYNSAIMECAGEAEVFQHENELGPAFDGKETPVNVAAASIYEILQAKAFEVIREVEAELPTCDECGRLMIEDWQDQHTEEEIAKMGDTVHCKGCQEELAEASSEAEQ